MEKQVAVLIDGDNIPSKYAKYIKQEATQYGNIKICRLYGSVNCPNVKSWYRVMPNQGITPMLQISYANGKSIADQALTIDAMDILHSDKIDIFCIVSSDSDFTKLVYRLKENAGMVIGMGELKAKESLANACDEFKILDLIYKDETNEDETNSSEEIEGTDGEPIQDELIIEDELEESEISIPEENEVIEAVLTSLETIFEDEEKVHLSKIGLFLSQKWSGFDARNYGYKNIKQLLKKHSDKISIDDEKASDGIHYVSYVCRK
ncbi:MAG: NYN domain-containing protein [Butyrivibrio sp.]|nr:NYN domain-containing protein [Butyrivibrio sp.]